jgi:hypothetical protein
MLTIPSTRADWVFVINTYDGTFVIDPGSWFNLYAYRSEGYKAEFDLEVIAGGNRDIDFFICDQGNYTLWSSGYTATVYKLHENVVSYSSNFIYPHSDTWYFVFSNTFSLISSKTVQFTNDLYEWQTTPTTPSIPGILPLAFLGFGIGVIGIITAIVILIVIYVTRKREVPTPPPTTVHQCPQCNTHLTGNETYCGQCGTKLQ